MTIPFATTKITVLRNTDPDAEPYQEPAPRTEIATGIRAVLSGAAGAEIRAGGEQVRTRTRFHCDPTDVNHTDQVRDETTGILYNVLWVDYRPGPIEFIFGDLGKVEGAI